MATEQKVVFYHKLYCIFLCSLGIQLCEVYTQISHTYCAFYITWNDLLCLAFYSKGKKKKKKIYIYVLRARGFMGPQAFYTPQDLLADESSSWSTAKVPAAW